MTLADLWNRGTLHEAYTSPRSIRAYPQTAIVLHFQQQVSKLGQLGSTDACKVEQLSELLVPHPACFMAIQCFVRQHWLGLEDYECFEFRFVVALSQTIMHQLPGGDQD